MTTIEHTPGPWNYDMDYIVAPDPTGRHPDIYIAEIAHSDEEGRIASPEQQDANRHLIAAAPALLTSLRAVLPYAESEWQSLFDCWRRDGDPAVEDEVKACGQAIAAAQEAIALTIVDGPPLESSVSSVGNRPYSVLLLYPDYLNDTGAETYYAFVEARDPIEAVAIAKGEAAADDSPDIGDPDDFVPLLVTEGHRRSEPLFNK